ncbi:hypothetical protein GUITHDRAFT_134358 [Guillardia theta CCMP2712]|uniref:Uncharacterized protein n=2 Tax=Guillardia theta TaxID=55529 RepID=L1JS88_GUITC|nr:hypothetical protein GUITHDRAFT_134358 [Guillardia theta CCMP2712]EKX51421.1 hypothetical protein GUITHDRAFT_134358 [Guillardia theta CCMP2712]|eukprot:XP_005838401.1 hypothetical protein GUITHDRAFT_134358 [Guillardia theta CCMP2712]
MMGHKHLKSTGWNRSLSQHDFEIFFDPAISLENRSEADESFHVAYENQEDCYPRLLSSRLIRRRQGPFRLKIVDIFNSARKDFRLLQVLQLLGARCFHGEVYAGRTLDRRKKKNSETGSIEWQEVYDDLSDSSRPEDVGVAEEEAKNKELLDYLSSVASKNGNSLQDKLIFARNNIFRNESWRVFCSRRPFSSAVTLRWMQMVLFVVGLLFLLRPPNAILFAPWSQVQELEMQSFSLVRFQALQLRNGATGKAITSAGISSFGIMRGGCPLLHTNASAADGSSEILFFPSPTSFDGWFLTTGKGPVDQDPVKFALEGSHDGVNWRLITLSKQCGNHRGEILSSRQQVLSDVPEFHLPAARNVAVPFNFIDFDCLWPEYAYIVARAISGLIMLAAAVVAFLEKYSIPVKIISFGFTFLYLLSLCSSAVLMANGHDYKLSVYGNPVSLLIEALVGITIFPVPLIVSEALVFEQTICSSMILIVSGFTLAKSEDWPVISIVILATVLFLVVLRERIRWNGRRIISGDVKLFESEWRELLEQGETLLVLDKVNKVARAMVKSDSSTLTPRQQTMMTSTMACVEAPSFRVRSTRDLLDGPTGLVSSRRLHLWERNSPMFSSLIAKFNVSSQRAWTHVRGWVVSAPWRRRRRRGDDELQEVQVMTQGNEANLRVAGQEGLRERQEASLTTQERLAAIMQQRSCFPGDLLMSRLSEFRLAVKNADTASVLFTDNPVFLSIHKPWIRSIIGLAGIYFLYYFFNPHGSLQQALGTNKFSARSVSLEFADPPAPPLSLVADFALTRDGCRVPAETVTQLGTKTIRIDYTDDVTANGYTLSTRPASSSEVTKLEFSISYSSSSNQTFALSAAPCRWGIDYTACMAVPVGHVEAGKKLVIDIRPPWFSILGTCVVYIPIFIGCLAVPVLTQQGKTMAPTAAFSFCFWAPGLMELITAGALARSEHAQDSFYWWVIGLTSLIFGYIVQFEGKRFISFIPFNWGFNISGLILYNLVIITPSHATSWVPISATIMMGFWVVLISLRQYVLFKSWHAIAPDKQKYDRAWEELRAREENKMEIDKLAKVVARQDTKNKLVRQAFAASSALLADSEAQHCKFLETYEGVHPNPLLCRVKLLVLDRFMTLKTADGHKRYVEFRNKRCE